ncbi:hypothetical protein EXS71_02760 [Candidatus Uhrbacteria bacterium]|nr:hypothetical protein [Candidatus Uhrbacteria bacterium]
MSFMLYYLSQMNMNGKSVLRWLILGLPFALPFYLVRFHVGSLPTTLLEVYFGLMVILFLYECGWPGVCDGWNQLSRWRVPMIAWFAVGLLSIFVSPNFFVSLGLWRAYILEPLMIFFIVMTVVRVEEDVRRLRSNLFLVVLMLGILSLIQFFTGWGIPHPWDVSILAGRRAVGPFLYPNALALFVTPVGAWAFALWVTKITSIKSQASKIWNLEFGTWIFSLIVILVARSNGGLVAFLVTALLILACASRTTRRVAGGLIVLAVAVCVIATPIRSKVVKTLTFHQWSGQVRLFIWRETWQMLKDRPIFGAGLSGYPIVFKPYHRATAIEIFQYPHNILFNFWSEMGLLGVIVFGWILIIWIRSGRGAVSAPWARGGVIPPLLAILIHGLVDVPYFKNDLAILFWLLIFLTTAEVTIEA